RSWPRRGGLRRFPRGRRTAGLAGAAARTDRLWRLAVSIVLGVRRQSAADQPREPGRRGLVEPCRGWAERAHVGWARQLRGGDRAPPRPVAAAARSTGHGRTCRRGR